MKAQTVRRKEHCQGMMRPDLPSAYVRIVRELTAIEQRVAETEERIRRHSEEIEKLRAKGLDAEFQTMIVRENESILALHLGMHAKLLVQLSMI
jgi:hypothetical protein